MCHRLASVKVCIPAVHCHQAQDHKLKEKEEEERYEDQNNDMRLVPTID